MSDLPVTLALFGGGIGYGEVLLILFVALLVFGRRLPEVGRSLGQGLNEFKRGLKAPPDEDAEAEIKDAATSESLPAPPEAPAPPPPSEPKEEAAEASDTEGEEKG